MRLITRADLDGLACAILLQQVEAIEEIDFAHPKDVRDGNVAVSPNDVIANLPYDDRAALWFDHDVSQADAPASAARAIAGHFKSDRFTRFAELLEATDKLDAARLSREDIVDPQGWILVAYTLDRRSGLGPFREYFRHLMILAREKTVEHILDDAEVRSRVERLKREEAAFREHLLASSRQDGNVVINDVRGMRELPSGNRFLIYDLFPDANVSIRVADGRRNEFITIHVGRNILKRDCKTSVGDLLAGYGGGGHQGAGSCRIEPANADRILAEIVEALHRNG